MLNEEEYMKKLDKKSLIYGMSGFLVGAAIMMPTIASAHPDDSGFKGTIGEIKAEVFGFDSVDELKQASKDKDSRKEIAENAGFGSREEVRDAVATAVASSDKLTDEQKQEFSDRMEERSEKRAEFEDAAAEFLGISVDELKQAHEDGKKIDELLEDSDKTHEEFKEFLEDKGIDGPRAKHGGRHHRGGPERGEEAS